jgi:ABC-type multidrug transport system fused ATPase/permease subunit
LSSFAENVFKLGFRRRTVVTVLALNLLSTVFESFGIGMLLPVFQLIQAGGDSASLAGESQVWSWLLRAYGFVGLEVTVLVLLATSMAAILTRQIFIYIRTLYTTRAALNFTRGLRDRAFCGFIHARLGYAQSERQGHIINDLTIEADRATQCVMAMIALGGHLVLGAVYLVFLFLLSLPMTVMALVVMGLASLPALRLMRRSSEVSHRIVSANRNLVDFLVQRVKSLRLMRLSGTEDAEHRELSQRTQRLVDTTYTSNVLMARVKLLLEPAIVAIGFSLLYLGVTEWGVKLEEIGLFLVIVLRLMPVLVEALHGRQRILVNTQSLRVVRERLEALYDAKEETGGARQLETLSREIAFEHVSFGYNGGDQVALEDVSVVIPAGHVTALVGPSGSGKSTLVDLLPRLREAQQGRITFDGVPAGEFALTSLRAGIAYAPQMPQIFDVTAAEHIRYGRLDAKQADIERAARLAGAHDFILDLPQGYHTLVGEAGSLLSGGQRQRLDLARVLLSEAPILILDEPTSHLDAEAEEQFRHALQRIRQETSITVIVVAHRLSTIALADRILALVEGRIEEVGVHEQLITGSGWYAKAYRKQQGADIVAAANTPADLGGAVGEIA